jgi:hypothetical protein
VTLLGKYLVTLVSLVVQHNSGILQITWGCHSILMTLLALGFPPKFSPLLALIQGHFQSPFSDENSFLVQLLVSLTAVTSQKLHRRKTRFAKGGGG